MSSTNGHSGEEWTALRPLVEQGQAHRRAMDAEHAAVETFVRCAHQVARKLREAHPGATARAMRRALERVEREEHAR